MLTKPKSRRKPRRGQDTTETPASAAQNDVVDQSGLDDSATIKGRGNGRAGRPSSYEDEKADALCELIATSHDSLATICKKEGMPSVMTVFRWLRSNEEFRDQYARAKREQAELLVEELVEIADDTSKDTIDTDKGDFPNKEWMLRSKLRVDTRKWIAAKLLPKKYGEKLEMEHSGKIDSTVTLTEAKRAQILERRRAALTEGNN